MILVEFDHTKTRYSNFAEGMVFQIKGRAFLPMVH